MPTLKKTLVPMDEQWKAVSKWAHRLVLPGYRKSEDGNATLNQMVSIETPLYSINVWQLRTAMGEQNFLVKNDAFLDSEIVHGVYDQYTEALTAAYRLAIQLITTI